MKEEKRMAKSNNSGLILVMGGSGSGKSVCAEEIVRSSGLSSICYLATMKIWDEEGKEKAKNHRERRRTYGWTTIEKQESISKVLPALLGGGQDTGILLEDLPNLLANEMFKDTYVAGKDAGVKILKDLLSLKAHCALMVIVTGDVFADGLPYEKETQDYIAALGYLHKSLAEKADEVIETVCGIPVILKECRKNGQER